MIKQSQRNFLVDRKIQIIHPMLAMKTAASAMPPEAGRDVALSLPELLLLEMGTIFYKNR